MKIVQINTFPYKATGSIMMNIHNYLLTQGIDSYVINPSLVRATDPKIICCNNQKIKKRLAWNTHYDIFDTIKVILEKYGE